LDRPLLFVVDGAPALWKAIRAACPLAVLHRCQIHKRRNVLDHLPDAMRPSVRRALDEAYHLGDAALAERRLERLAAGLEATHPGAARSLREGLADTLTLQRLGVSGALYRTLRSTNMIENLNGLVGHFTRNVRRWRNGAMLVRWIGAAVHDVQGRFRKLRGYRDLARRLMTSRRRCARLGKTSISLTPLGNPTRERSGGSLQPMSVCLPLIRVGVSSLPRMATCSPFCCGTTIRRLDSRFGRR
jgi:transposase-like protein